MRKMIVFVICLLTKHWIAIDTLHVRLRILFEIHWSGKLYKREKGGRRVEEGGGLVMERISGWLGVEC